MRSLEQIEQEMGGDVPIPGRLADFRVYLAALYSLRAAEMQKILSGKAALWLDMRTEKNSDTATDTEWEATDQGQRELQLKWELRRIDKLSAAIASKLRVMEGELRGKIEKKRQGKSEFFRYKPKPTETEYTAAAAEICRRFDAGAPAEQIFAV